MISKTSPLSSFSIKVEVLKFVIDIRREQNVLINRRGAVSWAEKRSYP